MRYAPGERIVLRGRFIWSAGLCFDESAHAVWTVIACACDLCALGNHVLTACGRHFHIGNVRGMSELVVDDLPRGSWGGVVTGRMPLGRR